MRNGSYDYSAKWSQSQGTLIGSSDFDSSNEDRSNAYFEDSVHTGLLRDVRPNVIDTEKMYRHVISFVLLSPERVSTW